MVKKDQTRESAASIELELFRICHTSTDIKNLTRDLITVFKQYTGCEAVGLRLHRGDDFPYFEVHGFENEFVEAERYLCANNADGSLQVDSAGNPVLECMCGNVIRGRFDPSKPFFTSNGSFWTNSTTKLLASTTEADRQTRTRNRCNGEGYESVALIPVKAQGRTLGLIQFNDCRENMFTLKQIEILERLAEYTAMAIANLETQHALTESENRYRRMVESSTEGIWGMDANHITTFVNNQMAGMLGYSIEEMLGKPVEAFFFAEDLPHHELLMAEREKGADDRYERRFRRKDGSTMWTIVSPKPIMDENGVFTGSFAMFTDITARKRMEDVQSTRLHLVRFAEHHSLDELLQEGLDLIEELTGSKIGFCHFLEDDQNTLTLQAWSSRTNSTFCNAEGKGFHYSVDQAGVWVDCLREHRPVIHNDYFSLPHRKGTPEGHPKVIRELVVPIFRGDKITAIFGVGNKPQDYNQQDVSIVTLFADMVWDIAERKLTDIKLKESENRYQRLTDNAVDIIFHYDITPEMKLTYINPAVERITGYTPVECYSDPYLMLNLIHPDDKPRMAEFVQSLTIPDEPLVMRWVGKDGTSRWMESRITPVFDHNQKLIAVDGITRDVTARKQVEETYKKYEQILASTRDGIALLDRNYRYIAVNPAYEVFSGKKREEIVGLTVAEYLGEKVFKDLVKEQFDRCLKGELIEYEAVINYPVLGDRWVRVTYYPYFDLNHEITGIVSNTSDITNHKLAEIREHKSEEEYRNLLESSPNGIFVVQDGVYKYANQKGMMMLHCSAEQVNGLPALDIVHPDDRAAIVERIKRTESGSANEFMRVRIIRPDGTTLFSESSSVPIDYNGKPAALIVSRDMSSQIELERSLEDTRQLQNVMLENINLGIVLVAVNGNIIQGNHEFFKMLGYQEEDLPGISVASITASESREQTGAAIQRLISGQDPVLAMEKMYLRKDGSRFCATTNATAVRDTEGKVLYLAAFIQDITEQKLAEKQIIESESLFRSFVESANDIVYSLSPEGNFTYVSPNSRDILDTDPEEFIGRPFEAFVHPEDRLQCWDFLHGILETGQKNSGVEYRVKHKNGEWRWHTSNGSPLMDSNGKAIAFLGISRDTTERRETAEKLELEKNLLQQSQEMANMGSFVWDLRDDSLTWSRNMFILHGLDPDAQVGNLSDVSRRLIHPEDLPRVQTEISKMVAARQVWAMQFRIVRADNKIRIMQSSGEFELDSCGNPVRCIGIHQDITERKEAEDTLWKSEEKLRIIASNTPDHIIMQDKDLRYTFVLNPQLGLTEEDMIGRTDRDFLSEYEAERLISAKKQVLETGHPLEFETSLVSRSGTLEYFSGTFVPSFTANGEVDGLIGYFRNITEQKIVQEALAREKRRLENIITGTNTGTWELDLQTGNSVINERWAEILGHTLEELAPTTYETWSNLVHPDDLERARDAESEHFDGRSEFYEAEFRMRHKDGHWVWVLSKGKLIARAADGKPYLMYGTHQDITERKNAEQSIRESSEQFQTLISTSLDGFFINDASGAILEANPAYCQMLGYQPEELLKLKVSDIDVIETPEMVAHHIAETIRKGSDRFEARHRCKDGQIIDVEIISTHVPSRDIFQVFIHNITEQRLTQVNLALERLRLADIITATNAGTWEWNIETGENIFNDRWAEMIGYTLDEISPTTYETWLKIVHPDDLKISSALQEKHFKGEPDYYECELRMRHKDGHWVWVIDRGKVTKWSDDGKPLMMYGTHQDITERKEAEAALQENQEMLSLFISNSPIYTFIKEVTATESRVLQVSDNYNKMIGIPSWEMVGKTMGELFPAEFAAKITADDWEVVQKGKVLQLDEKLNDHNYTTIKFPIQQRDRKLLAGYTIDISERKQAEAELIKHQKLLEESQNIARLGSYIVDFENSSRYWTKEMYRIFAMDENLPPPAFGEFQSLIHPDDAKYEHDHFIESKQTGSKMDITYRIITLDGETRYVHEIGTPTFDNNGNVTKITGSLQDVTEAKLAEEKLQESEARFRNMADTAPVLIWTAGTDKLCDYFNKPWLDFTGRNLEQEIGNGWADNIHPDDFDQCWQIFSSSIDKQVTYSQEYRLRRADGVFRWVLDVGVPRFTPEGQFMGFIGTCTDITDIKLTEIKLLESESRFRILSELLPIGVYMTSKLGECQYANQKWLEIAGVSLREALGYGWSNALHPEDKEKVWAAWNRMVESHGNWGLEYRFITPEGKITWVYGLATPMKNEEGEISGYIGANMDITERKRLQDTLQASLAEKDVLLREVHHRVKNNLAAILGLLEMERQNTADPNAGKLLIDLSNRIKAMSTVHEKLYRSENLARIDFQDYLKSFISHLRTSFDYGMEITTKMEASGIELSLDIAVPCGLIVNELVTNALKYAFPDGKPGVRGENICEIRVSVDQEDSTYTLVVSDNGVGLPKNIDWREANSLGLRLVRMLGEHQLGGEIELDKSRGTRFMIRFNTKEREL